MQFELKSIRSIENIPLSGVLDSKVICSSLFLGFLHHSMKIEIHLGPLG